MNSSRLLSAISGTSKSPQTNTTSINTSSSNSSSSNSSSNTTSSNDRIESLILGAESLTSELYPSTIITNPATITWPSTLVIGGNTYIVSHTSTSHSTLTTSVPTTTSSFVPLSTSTVSTDNALPTSSSTISTILPTSTSASASSADANERLAQTRSYNDDRRLGIILGAIIGAVALAILAFVLFWMHRRKRLTGTYLRHQPPSDDAEIGAGSSPQGSGYNSMSFTREYQPLGASGPQMAALLPATLNRHPDASHQPPRENFQNDSSNTAYMPIQHPSEQAAVGSRDSSADRVPLSSDQQGIAGAGLAAAPLHGAQRRKRSPTPLMHEFMTSASGPVSPVSPSAQEAEPLNAAYASNPFSSDEDAEADSHDHSPFRDFGGVYDQSPPPPLRSSRRNSPIHYVSPPEASGFDFGLARGTSEASRYSQGPARYGR